MLVTRRRPSYVQVVVSPCGLVSRRPVPGRVEGPRGHLAARVRLAQDQAPLVVLEDPDTAEAVGDDLLTAGDVVPVFDDVSVRVDVPEQPPALVVLVADGLDTPLVLDRNEPVAGVVGELGNVVVPVFDGLEVAARVVRVRDDLAGGIGDGIDPPQAIAVEYHSLAAGMHDAIRSHQELVPVGVGDGLQAELPVDVERPAIGQGEAELLGVVELERGPVHQLDRSRPPTRNDEGGAAIARLEPAQGARPRLVEDGDVLRRQDLLAPRARLGVELVDLAVREGHRHQVGARRLDAVVPDDGAGDGPVPVEPGRHIAAQPQVRDLDPPADPEVAAALVPAVVGARDADGEPGHGDLEIEEREAEVPDLQVAAHHHAAGRRRGGAGGVQRDELDLVDAVEERRRIEGAEHAGDGAVATPKHDGHAAVGGNVLEPPLDEVLVAHGARDLDGRGDGGPVRQAGEARGGGRAVGRRRSEDQLTADPREELVTAPGQQASARRAVRWDRLVAAAGPRLLERRIDPGGGRGRAEGEGGAAVSDGNLRVRPLRREQPRGGDRVPPGLERDGVGGPRRHRLAGDTH